MKPMILNIYIIEKNGYQKRFCIWQYKIVFMKLEKKCSPIFPFELLYLRELRSGGGRLA